MDDLKPRLEGDALDQAAASKPAPKVTKEYMASRIASVDYTRLGATTTLCNLTLDNGYSVLGQSACVSPENYDEEVGQGYAYKDAFAKLWPLFGFLLAEQLKTAQPDNLTFGQALEAMQRGQPVTRAGWNGKGMFIYLVPANSYQAQTDTARRQFGDMVPYRAYVAMKTVDNEVVPWVSSQSDILATDWSVANA